MSETPVTMGKGGTARGFFGVERWVRLGSPGASSTNGFVLPAVDFYPAPDVPGVPDLRAPIDVADIVEVRVAAEGAARGNGSEEEGRSRTGGVVVDTLNELFAPRALVKDFLHLGSKNNLLMLGTGFAAGALVNGLGVDASAYHYFTADDRLPGDVTRALDSIGSSYVLHPAALATYFVGRALGQPRVRSTGAKLTQGLLLTGVLVSVTKVLTRRMRPDRRSAVSLPSGHTADVFTIASILQIDYGWKVGVPAYALAGLMGASRVDANRHFLSDVIVGATIGIVVGHTVGGRLERQGIQVGFLGAPDGGVGMGIGVAMDLSVLAGHVATH